MTLVRISLQNCICDKESVTVEVDVDELNEKIITQKANDIVQYIFPTFAMITEMCSLEGKTLDDMEFKNLTQTFKDKTILIRGEYLR